MLLLFAVALFCRLSATFMCSCTQDHEHDSTHSHTHEVHVCCSCPDHISDCSHHDKKYQDHSCHFHFSIDGAVAEEAIFEARNNNASSPDRASFILAYNILLNTPIFAESKSVDYFSYNRSCISQWSSVSIPLRAPPVLV